MDFRICLFFSLVYLSYISIKFYLGKIMRDEQLTEVVSGEKQQECGEVICIVSV